MTAPAAGDPRRIALDALDRIDPGGGYANLITRSTLDESSLAERDRHFVTELVHGTTRMRRACDHVVDRFLRPDVSARVRNALRLGAYQLVFLGTPAHAAVSATVAVAPKPARGLVNAVLRRVGELGPEVDWPDDATRLSYPDWIVAHLRADLGEADSLAALTTMNTPPAATERSDGYIQDRASQWVADLVGARPGERILDLCAAPGGKATAMAAAGARVVAGDIQPARAALIVENTARLRLDVPTLVADAGAPPLRAASFDRVLVDAPCSGLGALRRRPDARWRIDPTDLPRLADLQTRLLDAAAPLVVPGGWLVYSVCTLTDVETSGVDERFATVRPEWTAVAPPAAPWRSHGRGARLLPQDEGTDGMYALRLRRPA